MSRPRLRPTQSHVEPLRFLEGDRLRVAVAGEARGEVVGRVEEPGVAGFGREQDELVGGNDAPVMGSRPSLDIANLFGETKPTTVAQELSGVLGGRPSFPSRSATRAVSAAFVAMRIESREGESAAAKSDLRGSVPAGTPRQDVT